MLFTIGCCFFEIMVYIKFEEVMKSKKEPLESIHQF